MVVGFVYWLPNIRIFLLIQAKYDRASVSGEMFAIEDSYCFLVICIFFVELFIWRFPIWCLRGCLLCNGILSWLLTLYLYAYFIAEDSLGTFIILLSVYIRALIKLSTLFIDISAWLFISAINIILGYCIFSIAYDAIAMGPLISIRIIMSSISLLCILNFKFIDFVWRRFDLNNKRISGLLPIQRIYFISNYWLFWLFWVCQKIFFLRHKKVACDRDIYSALGIFHLEITKKFATIGLGAWRFSLSLTVRNGSESSVVFRGPRGIYYRRTSKLIFFVFSICMLLSLLVYVSYHLSSSEVSETAQYLIPAGPMINFFN